MLRELTNDQLVWLLWILFFAIIIMAIVTASVQKAFISKNQQYSMKQSSSGKTGAKVAHEILFKNKIEGVKIVQGKEGQDHFNPQTNTISLSPSVYGSSSVAAAAIAAHEVGHAIQFAKGSVLLKVRNALAIPVQITAQMMSSLMSVGLIFLLIIGFNTWLVWITVFGTLAYSATGIFQLVTLPIEFGASMRAKKELTSLGYMETENDVKGTKGVLNAAAMTYVVAFMTTVITLAWLIVRFILIARRNN